MTKKGSLEQGLWDRASQRLRADLRPQLERVEPCSFMDRSSTLEFGEQFWALVNARTPQREPLAMSSVLAHLREELRDRSVIWLHTHANDCGALRVAASKLLDGLPAVRPFWISDLLFATPSLDAGLALEREEYGVRLVWWVERHDDISL